MHDDQTLSDVGGSGAQFSVSDSSGSESSGNKNKNVCSFLFSY